MKNREVNRIRFLIMTFILVLMAPLFSLAQVYGADLITEQYDVNIKVHEDYSWDVEESIQMNFLTRHHGIYRYIPYAGTTYYDYEGREYATPYKIKFTNVKIPNYKYDKYKENKSMVLKIGDGNIYLEGLNIYSISYKAEAYQKPTEGFDQFYWGILPTDWNASIEKGSFSIEFPKAIDPDRVEFIAGSYGAGHTDWVDWYMEDERTIKARLNTSLYPGEGVTIRVLMEEGYFQGARNYNRLFWPMVFLIFLAPIMCFTMWRRHGIDPPSVKTVEFYPPGGLDPAQASYLVDNVIEGKDIVGLIIYLAHKGYLTIEEKGKKFKLIKNNEAGPPLTGHKRIIFDGLFKLEDEVDEKQLKKSFPSSVEKAKSNIREYYKNSEKHRIFSRESLRARTTALLVAGLPIMSIGILGTLYAYGTWEDVGLALFFLPGILLTYAFHTHNFDRRNTMGRFKKFIMRSAAGFLTFFLLLTQLFIVEEKGDIFLWGLLAIISSLICLIFVILMKKRTAYGAEMLGKILGFKEFLRVAELDRIKMLVEEDPTYFYATLPYAYVFGLTKVWAKKFEKITMSSPDWYSSASGAAFSHTVFMRSFNSYANTMNRVSVPKSSGSGGSSGSYSGGGGFSGGGMGGGGGGGW